ncbi:MAG TPA: sodium/solute symporter [Bacillota bacterium]|nr:sodium/solute symporter [Bacillota bacterium]
MGLDLALRWGAIGLFVLLMVGIGIYSMRRTKTTADFFLGGRDVGPWISAFAYGTTYFSAVMFIGYAGKLGWAYGASTVWIALGNGIIGSYLAWKVLAKRTRTMTASLSAMTMPEFLQERYQSKWFKIVGAILIFIFLIPYCASVFTGLGFLFENVLRIDYQVSLIVMIVITGVYLILGGYFAIALTDFIQGLIMLVGATLMVGIIFGQPQVGGVSGWLAGLHKIDPGLAQFVPKNWLPLASLVFMTSFGAWGMPQMVQKFYAIKNEKVIRTATIVVTLFALLIAGAAYISGSTVHLFYNSVPLDPAGKPAFNVLMPQLMSQTMPELLLIIIMLLVLSASMSTLSSLILVSSSAITIDLVKGVFNPKISQKSTVSLLRLLCGLFIICSIVIAIFKLDFIIKLMSLSWGTIAGAFLAPYLYGLYWKGTTKAGAWAGMIAGVGISVIGSIIFPDEKLAPMISSVAMTLPLLVVPVVSVMTKKFDAAHLNKVFGLESAKGLAEAAPTQE